MYDIKWSRVLVFARATGDYIEQWQTIGRVPPMDDLRGMYMVDPTSNKKGAPPTLVWLSPSGLYTSVLVDDPNAGPIATPAPDSSVSPDAPPATDATPRPRKTPKA